MTFPTKIPALSVQNVVKSYGSKRVLDQVSFDLPEGAVGALIGPNGAGKTTLFSIIASFLKPDQGEVFFSGKSLTSLPSLNGILSILPQDALFQSGITIERQFYWYARAVGLSHEAARRELRRVLTWVDLLEEASHDSNELSHGMHKRMAIAQALIGSPGVILLDEPTAGLDPANAHRVRKLIRGLRGKRTILLSSHNLDEIAELCDYIVIIDKGKIVESKSIAQLTQQDHRLHFTLTQASPPGLLANLGNLEGVERAEFSRDDDTSLICHVHASFSEDPAILPRVLAAISTAGADFSTLTQGARLEDRFLELTGKA